MSDSIPFESSMTELEHIVRQLEKGDLSLKESLQQFEKGIGLARQCQSILQDAEQKVELLLNESYPDESNR